MRCSGFALSAKCDVTRRVWQWAGTSTSAADTAASSRAACLTPRTPRTPRIPHTPRTRRCRTPVCPVSTQPPSDQPPRPAETAAPRCKRYPLSLTLFSRRVLIVPYNPVPICIRYPGRGFQSKIQIVKQLSSFQ